MIVFTCSFLSAVASVRRDGCSNVGLLVKQDFEASGTINIDVVVDDAVALVLLHLVLNESQSFGQVEVVIGGQYLARPVHNKC